MFYVQIASASPEFLKWLENNIERLIGAKGKIIKGARSFQLRFAKKASYKIIQKMYYAPGVIHLKRKFTKIQKTITIDQQQPEKYAQVEELVDSQA